MTLPHPINANQTDAKSPIDQQLMDAYRLNQEYLDTAISGASSGGLINFKVNGYLNRIKALLTSGAGRRLDGGIVSNAVTFTKARLYLEKGGDQGALECDVLRHVILNHGIEDITGQYSGNTQAVGRLGSSVNTQAVSIATPIINTQQITKPKASVNIDSIADLTGNDFLYTFSGSTLLDSDYEVGDSITFASCTNAANDGEFVIKSINYDNLPSVVINNASGVEQIATAGTGTLSVYEYTFLASVDDDFVVGENVILAGHTNAANDGTREIKKVNQGGNNIWVKHAAGVVQGGVAGTAQCTRWLYAFASALDDTQYIVGEKAYFAGHTSGANDGSFIIRRVNIAGNNIVVTNESGVSQGGAAGTTDTLRWLYSTSTDISADVSVGDNMVMTSHTSANNDGTFVVTFVNRFAVNNIEVYNENGVVQAGVAGVQTSARKIVSFKEDFSSSYLAGTSTISFDGIQVATGSQLVEYDVVEVNRGIGQFNIVIDAAGIIEQLVSAGRVAREVRSLFTQKPKITLDPNNLQRDILTDTTSTLNGTAVAADNVLTLEILEVPTGLPSTMVLSLS